MTISGMWAEQFHRLEPQQWVNVWQLNPWGGCEFYMTCQAHELAELFEQANEPIDQFGLELIDEAGNRMPIPQLQP